MEKTILRNLLTDGDYFSKVFTYLKDEHFQGVAESTIFHKISEYYKEYSVQPTAKEIGLGIKGDSLIQSDVKTIAIEGFKSILTEDNVSNPKFLIDETEKYIKKIEMVEAIYKSATVIEKNEPFENVLGFIQSALEMNFDYDTGIDYKDSTEDRYEYYVQCLSGILMGIPSLDNALDGGLRKKTLNIIAGPSHSGKSAMLVASAASAAIKGNNVLFLTLEMPEMEIGKRVDSNLMNFPANDMKTLTKEQYVEKFKAIEPYVGNLKIKEYPAGYMDTLKLQALMNDLETESDFKPDLVVIDYLTLMSSSRITLANAGGNYQYYKYIAEELHGFSKINDVPVLSAAQLNRTAIGNLEADASSISDSLGIFMTADNVLALLSNEQMVIDKKIMAKWLKNRNSGKLETSIIGSDFATMRFFDIDIDPVQNITNLVQPMVPVGDTGFDTDAFDFSSLT